MTLNTTEGLAQLLEQLDENDPNRWEIGFRNIVAAALGNDADFDIKDVVRQVKERLNPTPSSDNVLVLVEAHQGFLMRYVVQTPKDHPEWALDTVTCHEAVEFTQKPIEEVILSSRVISQEEFNRIFEEENAYLSAWDDEKRKTLVTVINSDGSLTNAAPK